MKIAVFASGRGSNLQALMDAAGAGLLKAEIRSVLCNVENAQALKRAGRYGIPNQFLSSGEFESAALRIVREAGVQLICLAGYMRILSPAFIQEAGVPILNVHPSLLPSFPGLNAQRQALEYGAKFTGATVHLVDEQIDHGPIVIQAAVPVHPDDDEATLSARILKMEHRIYPQAVRWFAEGRVSIQERRVKIRNARHRVRSVVNPSES